MCGAIASGLNEVKEIAARRGSYRDIAEGPPVGAIGEAGRDYVQDERYIAIEHMDVRRDCFGIERG